jgi:amino acid transporter
MLFALGRDGILRRELADVSTATGTPLVALAVEMSISLALIVGFAIAGTAAITTFFYIATMGILSLLVMYIVTNVGALRYLFLDGVHRAASWEIVLPVGGIGFAIYTLYKNVWPVPDYPFNLFPYIVTAWLVVGLGVAILIPGFATRVRMELGSRTEVAEDGPAAVGSAVPSL